MYYCGYISTTIFVSFVPYIANADIYFDETLRKLPPPIAGLSPSDNPSASSTNAMFAGKRRYWHNTVLALSKWIDKGVREHFQLYLRTDSQDAWIFQAPLMYTPDSSAGDDDLSEKQLLDFPIGLVRCDNRIAYVLSKDIHYSARNYSVINTPFVIHAIEYDKRPRQSGMYDTGGAIIGEGKSLLISDNVYNVF